MIPNKISVYGDSVALGLAARLAAHPQFAGYNDYARGGNSLAANLVGDCAGPLFNGLTFADHIQTVDDADIVVVHLGGNDTPVKRDGTLLTSGAVPSDYIGSDGLQIASDALQHIQYIKSTGKRPVICGVPYIDLDKLVSVMGITQNQAEGFVNRLNIVNEALRCAAGFTGAYFIATYGVPMNVGQPIADSTSTIDGVHPTATYADAVGNFLATQIISHFGL